MDNGTEPRAVASGTKTRRRPHQECFLMLEEFGGTTPACAFIPLATARGSVASGTKTRRRPHQECFLMLEEFGGTTPACAFIPLATARGSVPSHHLSEFLYKTSRLNL